MKSHLLFGLLCEELTAARRSIETALQIQMEPRESSYRGGEYYRSGRHGTEHFILQKNFDELEGEWAEPSFSNYGVLLYVGQTERGDEIAKLIGSKAQLLHRREG